MESPELALAVIERTKREECKRIKHGVHFSNWKVLVGPSDWEDHSLGKEGADRYRVHNLPTTSGPGLYELGIAVSHTDLGRKADKIDSCGLFVVYLGQADNVRARLQCYGRSGAHLNNPNDGPGCFDDIFSRGYSIVYRLAPLKNKEAALETEKKLLNKYDYAWNKSGNGTSRHDDVLPKLDKVCANANEDCTGICGVSLGDGLVCRRPPVEGRKRCSQHRGLRISVSNPVKLPVVAEKCPIDEGFSSICGVVLDDGSLCRRPLVQGNKRCEEHEWRKINGSTSKTTGTLKYAPYIACDSNSRSGSNFSEMYRPEKVQPQGSPDRQPFKGRVRCEEHKGMKIKEIKSKSATQDKSHVYDEGSNFRTVDDRDYCSSVCGAQTLNGSYCRRPVKGNTRCWQHSKPVFDMGSTIRSSNDWYYGGSSVCGAPTQSGSYCGRTVNGGGRCWQHSKPVFDMGSTIRSCNDLYYGGSSVCGAPTRSGSYCRRTVNGGGRCWQH
ncbi:protein EFFECTOR OF TRANSCRIPTION 2-like [Melia azedarach]|uniref:Protein EFFECTOR OF TRANSCRIPTION 2-like n=1 Tax=Melia azedarach TaxID=155640 RepID=A0ACC1XBE7_MELAZ|nr:protein EFFECTOR OF TRANSCRIPTION 2-like [Melia azedarach]